MRDRNLSGNLEENSLGIRRRQRHLDDGVGKSVASPSRGSMLFEFGLGELAQIAHPVLIADSMYEDVEEHRPWDELAVGYTTFYGIVEIGGISVPQQRIYSVRSVARQVDDTARRLLKFTISLKYSLRAITERKRKRVESRFHRRVAIRTLKFLQQAWKKSEARHTMALCTLHLWPLQVMMRSLCSPVTNSLRNSTVSFARLRRDSSHLPPCDILLEYA